MRKAIAGAITLTTLTVAIQSIAQTPPPAPIMPPSLPAAHVVNLMTNEGSGAFGVQWRVADVRIVEVPAPINKDRYKITYLRNGSSSSNPQPISHVTNDHSNKPSSMPSAKSTMKRPKFMMCDAMMREALLRAQ